MMGSFADCVGTNRQAAQEPSQDCAGNGQGEGGSSEGQEEVGGTGYVLVSPRLGEHGVACLYVPTPSSRILWRIGNTRSSSYLFIDGSGCKKNFYNFIQLSKGSSRKNQRSSIKRLEGLLFLLVPKRRRNAPSSKDTLTKRTTIPLTKSTNKIGMLQSESYRPVKPQSLLLPVCAYSKRMEG